MSLLSRLVPLCCVVRSKPCTRREACRCKCGSVSWNELEAVQSSNCPWYLSHICTGTGLTPAASALGQGSPHPRQDSLHRDWARPCHICTRTELTHPHLPCPHLHRHWARPAHICTGTGRIPATFAPGLGPPAATSAPGLGASRPRLHGGLHGDWVHRAHIWDWAHPVHICTGTVLAVRRRLLCACGPACACGVACKCEAPGSLRLAKSCDDWIDYIHERQLQRPPAEVEPPPAGDGAGETDGLCVVCLDRCAVMAVLPCGHRCLCKEDAARLRSLRPRKKRQDGMGIKTLECPVCRGPVSSIVRVYS